MEGLSDSSLERARFYDDDHHHLSVDKMVGKHSCKPRTPVTRYIVNVSDFRSTVQQLTGLRSTSSIYPNRALDDTAINQFEVGEETTSWKWKAFYEFLKNLQPPRSLSECTADDAVEFLRGLPSDRIEAVVERLSMDNFSAITGKHNGNPFDSPVVTKFLKERVKEKASDKENLLEKYLTARDVSNLDRLVITANHEVGKYFRLATILKGTDSLLRLADEEGKPWLFGYSYLNVSQCYEFTKGWSNYVKEKHLGAGDVVFFKPNGTDSSMLFIGFKKSDEGEAALEKRDKLWFPDPETIGTPLQLRLPEPSVTGFDPVLVIFCGDNQESEETYFISYIFSELCLHGFAPFRYDLKRNAVTENQEMLYSSRVGIIIISMNYVCSRECLDEFVTIMDHSKANGIMLIPVFSKVSLSAFRGQSGSFGRAFSLLGNSIHASQVMKWKTAMIELTSINRYHYMKGDEILLAKNIVGAVCLLLSSDTNSNSKRTRLQLKSILSLLHGSQCSAPQIVGLWGMAGIGKTTITREIFRTQAEKYDVCYFLPHFHIMCQKKGLTQLRDEFLSKIFGEEKFFIDACDTKQSFKRDKFLDKRVLVILDDVSNARDAEVLVGGFGWFSGGHTIILTSRNRQVLVKCNVKALYEIQKLSKPVSFRLCHQYSANWKGNISLLSELANYASGIPLALRVLGSSVRKKCIANEKEHLRRLRQYPPVEIYDAFSRSFDGLDDNEKNTFLDLACFFRGENKDHVVNILDGCGFFTDLGICGLIDESLTSLVDNRIEIPNIFQDTGRFVVYQENSEAGKRSRLWDPNDIVDVLTNNLGTGANEGIFLDASGLTFALKSNVFERMYRLRLLKLHFPTSENYGKVYLPQGLCSLPDELRLLHWERYPLSSLPRNYNPKKLVELNMPYSNMTYLWKGTKNLEKLKRIILSHSPQLSKFPRLSKARNLEYIDLEGCVNLVKVNSSILHHRKLTFLSLKDCSHLRLMPPTVHLESLEVLNLSGCTELENLQDFSPNLKELYLAGTAIKEMPSSIGDLTKLVTLDLENCEKLQHLPPGISNLKAIITLKLSGCSNLKSLPNHDALFLRDSKRPNTMMTMEESVPLNFQSAIQESRDVEEFLPAFEYRSSDGIPQEIWPRVTIIPFPSLILHSLASRLYALVVTLTLWIYLKNYAGLVQL